MYSRIEDIRKGFFISDTELSDKRLSFPNGEATNKTGEAATLPFSRRSERQLTRKKGLRPLQLLRVKPLHQSNQYRLIGKLQSSSEQPLTRKQKERSETLYIFYSRLIPS